MRSELMSTHMSEFFAEADQLQIRKNADYHPDRVAFLEILRTACETGITVEQDLWAKVRKHYVSLRGYLIDGRFETEIPRSRMIDIAVYMAMIAVWDQHKVEIVDYATKFMRRQSCETPVSDRTCLEMGRKDSCDRCRFLGWLRDYAR